MLDLSKIQKTLITSQSEFFNWFENLFQYQTHLLGFDIETNGEDFPKTELAGFSVYNYRLGEACYVPIDHYQIEKEYCISLEKIKVGMQKIFDKHTLVTHGGAYDFLLLNKLGFRFENAIDSYLIAVALQFQNLGLKELVLEFGIAKFQDVITFKGLMSKLGFPENYVDFSKIDVQMNKDAFNYAVNDSIFAYHLAEILYGRYMEYIKGDHSTSIMQAQVDTMLLLSESSAVGYCVNEGFLNQFIENYGTELKTFENDLMNQVRKEMGWG